MKLFYGRPLSAYYQLFLYLFIFLPLFHLFNLFHRLANFIKNNNNNNNHLIDVRRILWIPRTRVLLPEMRVLHVHARYEDAREFAWRDPNVHLFCVTKKGAIFFRTKGGLKIFKSEVRSFMNDSIKDFAIEFGIVPLMTFQEIAALETEMETITKGHDKMAQQASQQIYQTPTNPLTEMNKPTVVVIGIQGRSGSTLLSQNFENLHQALVFNQPKAILDIAQDVFTSEGALMDFLPTTLTFLAKSLWIVKGISIVVLKLGARSTLLIRDIFDLHFQLPFQTKFLFSYRHLGDSFKSVMRLTTQMATDSFGLAGQLPLLQQWFPDFAVAETGNVFPPMMISGLKRIIGNEIEWQRKFAWIENLDFLTRNLELITRSRTGSNRKCVVSLGKTSMTSHFVCFLLIPLLVLRELQKQSNYRNQVLPISYEEIMRDSSIWLLRILPFCGISASKGLALKTQDSQAKSQLGNEWMKKQHLTSLSESDWNKLDCIVKASGIAGSIYDEVQDYKLN